MSCEVRVVRAEEDSGAESLHLDCTLELLRDVNIIDALAPGLETLI